MVKLDMDNGIRALSEGEEGPGVEAESVLTDSKSVSCGLVVLEKRVLEVPVLLALALL
jgi:hypothetical protein